jgi:hypothetical protein
MGETSGPPPPDKASEPGQTGRPDAQALQGPAETRGGRRQSLHRLRFSREYAFAAYVVIAVAGLIVLRALVDALNFISVGWIIILVVLPLLPWLTPRFGEFLEKISPYVRSFTLAGVQVEFPAVRSEPIAIPTTGIHFAGVPNDASALSAGTTIRELVLSLRKRRREGGSPTGIIDLREGRKWRLPNLYFLARLLEIDPVVSELVFTEIREGIDRYLVGTCRPDELRHHIEQAEPDYAAAAATVGLPAELDLADPAQANELGPKFQSFLQALGTRLDRSSPLIAFLISAGPL